MEPNRAVQIVSSECTYPEDLTDLARIREEIAGGPRQRLWLAQGTPRAHREHQGPLRRFHDHHAKPFGEATSDPDEIAGARVALLEKTEAGRRPVRLLGAGVQNLEPLGGPRDSEGPQLRFED